MFRYESGSVSSLFIASIVALAFADGGCGSSVSNTAGSAGNASQSAGGSGSATSTGGSGNAVNFGGAQNQAGGQSAAAGASTGGQPSMVSGAGGMGSVIITPPSQPLSKFIVVDQFGYLPEAEKIAVIRDPQQGFDAMSSFTPGASYALVDAASGKNVLSGVAAPWNGGAVDASSGDKAWWFDFSSVTTPGTYYVLDVNNAVRSDLFDISDTVYREVLKRAVRMLFYQRVGQAKDAKWAGAAWADTASHVGPGQDHEARLFSDKDNAATAKDVWGGWFDAGDYNKYTNWTASYVDALLHAYLENKSIWRDDYEIPESGNGIPDVLDEAKWGLDYLTRLQNSDGSVLSIVGEASASPPSAATGASYYGPASTSSTLSAAGAYAFGATVLGSLGNASLSSYVADLQSRALKAWAWAAANPSVQFLNNDSASGSAGLGAGQQEPSDDYGRLAIKLEASVYLFELTGDATYSAFFDANYASRQMVKSGFVYPFEEPTQEALLYYSALSGATPSVKTAIKTAFANGMNSTDNFKALLGNQDPYLAYMKDYVWGSNSTKSNQGLQFADMITFGIDASKNADSLRGAERYIHYIHGLNPLGFVYLSNMYDYGAVNGVNTFYHTWFCDGSKLWDAVGVSTYGPPPGYLTGGANPSYTVDSCCSSGCDGNSCTTESLTPPEGQPAQKSYKDFNSNWPLDSWQVTEDSDGYQVAYIRLLSKFVK